MNIPILPTLLFSIFMILVFSAQKSPPLCEASIEIGKKIYTRGTGEGDQKIIAVVFGSDMPATMMACINCHLECGEGTMLPGVEVPDIRRANLKERYIKNGAAENANKVINNKLRKAIALGFKNEDEVMHKMMPQYKMSMKDMNHLLAYLAVLGEEESCS